VNGLMYGCLLVPLIAIIFLAIKFKARMAIWEYVILFVVPLITIIIGKVISIHSQTVDTEYWNTYGIKAIYYEAWNEWITKTCEDCTETCTGSGEDRTCTETCVEYDCSYCDNNSAYWELIDNTGTSFGIPSYEFERITALWGNVKRVDRGKRCECECFGNGDQLDGDQYITVMSNANDIDMTVPICKQHTYENKVQCSKSVFNFQEIDSTTIADYKLYCYPHYESMGILHYNPLIGTKDGKAADRLNKHNARLGSFKQVHMMIVVFHNQPYDAALLQEAYWKKGNKNEFILCIGLSGNKIVWTYVISWTDEEELKIRVARKVKEMDYDLIAIADYMADEVKKNYVRKQFVDFSYISVEPTLKAVLITFFVTLIVTIAISIFAIANDFNFGDMTKGRRRW